jgi:hypothetical protein
MLTFAVPFIEDGLDERQRQPVFSVPLSRVAASIATEQSGYGLRIVLVVLHIFTL